MLTSILVLVGFMILTAIALERAVERRMLESQESNLKSLMYSILAAVDRDATGLSITVSDARLFEGALFNSSSGLKALLYDKKEEIWRSLSTEEPFYKLTDLEPEELRFSQVNYNGKLWFQMAFSIRWPNVHDKLSQYELVLWKDAKDHTDQLKHFKQILRLWLIITVSLLLVLIWLVMLWSLRPLRLIGEEVRAIENNQKQRFDSNYPAEIKPLTQNLNLLLQRDEHQMQRYRNAIDDLAHSLKTPLAVLGGLTEKSTKWSDEDRLTLQEQNNRMNQIVSYQLQKAAMLGGKPMTKPIDLSVLLEKTVAALRKVYKSKSKTITLNSDLSAYLRMDESDLLEILGNLIDNACKYGSRQVSINAIQQAKAILLTIEDDGAGLSPEKIEHIFTRGIRLDQSQEGQGIGLAVVKEIVDAYDISMNFDQSSLGGLKISLKFINI